MKENEALKYHESGRPGKIEVVPTKPHATQYDLSLAYSPGVAQPCLAIKDNSNDAYRYTAKENRKLSITRSKTYISDVYYSAIYSKELENEILL